MSLQFRATLIENNPKADRPQTTHWSEQEHAITWAKAIVEASPDPCAFVTITQLTERNVGIIQKQAKT
jgi:hypothetical protein